MRKVVLLVIPFLALLQGCQAFGWKARPGCHVEFYLPPSFNTEGVVLIQNSGQQVAAHPVANVAGPVTDGQFRQSPMQPIQPMPMGIPVSPKLIATPECVPSGFPSRLTVEEWIKLRNVEGANRKDVQE